MAAARAAALCPYIFATVRRPRTSDLRRSSRTTRGRALRRKVTSRRRTRSGRAVASHAMNQTIRDYIKGRVRWLFAVGVLGWLTFPLSQFAGRSQPVGAALPALGMLVFVGAILALNWAVKCPRCRANLGRTIAMTVGLSWGSGPKVNFCPYCGVSLDEPREKQTPAAQQQPFNPIR
jgi:hypothetical protein